jgi:pyrroline-5-carboxylate reductase
VDASGIVLLGVKPNTILSVCRNISKSCGSLTKKSFISIAAGVRLEDLEMAIPSAKGFVRTMPNINSLVGEAATSLALGTKLQEGGTSGETYQSCAAIFSAVGTISLLEDEDLMDAATGLAGSGPAFVFMLIESLGTTYSFYIPPPPLSHTHL